MQIDIDSLVFSETDPYYTEGAKAIIKALAPDAANGKELVKAIENDTSEAHAGYEKEFSYLQRLAIAALAHKGIY